MLNKDNLALLAEYDNSEIKILIREAFKNSFQIYTIDKEDKFFPIPIAKLQEIYTNQPNKVEVTFRPPIRDNYQIQDFGSWRNIGMGDLVLDKMIAASVLASNNAPILNEIPASIENTDIHEENSEEPKDRNSRLIRRAAQIVLANKQLKIADIQQQLLEEERNHSKVSMAILRKIITKKAIKNACKNIETMGT